MKRYVVGFAFGPDRREVILIKRKKADGHQGLFNGPGGRIEARERPEDAVVREFHEEAGILIKRDLWREIVHMEVEGQGEVYFFAADCPAELFYMARTASVEGGIRIILTTDLPWLALVPNAQWIIPLALDPCVELPLHIKNK